MASVGKRWGELRAKLLAIGGTKVEPLRGGVTPSQLLSRGVQFTQPVLLQRGMRHKCHRNSAEVWAQDVKKHRLCRGYALSDGRWLEHSWVLAEGYLIETTYRMQAYFGLIRSPQEACESWFYNFLEERYPGPVAMLYPAF